MIERFAFGSAHCRAVARSAIGAFALLSCLLAAKSCLGQGAAGGRPKSATAADAAISEGMSDIQRGDLSAAHEAFANAVELAPSSAAAEFRTGNEIVKRQTNQQAAVLALRSGERLLNAGDLEGAISQFRAAIGAAPESAKAHYKLGLALKEKRRFIRCGWGTRNGAPIRPEVYCSVEPRVDRRSTPMRRREARRSVWPAITLS